MFKNFSIQMKRFLVTIMCLSLLMPSFSNIVYAASETTDVDFIVNATEVNITVPIEFAVTINPNLPYYEGGFNYSDNITVTNETTCPITLGISSFADEANTFENDVLPSDVDDWDNLSVKGTKKYFALGILGSDDTEWMNYNLDSALYAKTINESTDNIYFGEIKPSQSVNFDLEASYGKAVKEGFTFTYQITWVSELYDGGSGDSGSTTNSTKTTVDKEATTNLEYETTTNQVASASLLDEIFGVETAMAASIEDYYQEIDESKIVGTAKIVGLSDASATDVFICDYYEDNEGNLYEIVEIEAGTTSEGTISSDTIQNVTIVGEGLNSISDYAFLKNTNLVNVIISNDISSIGINAFAFCENLKSIEIPNSVTTIQQGAFYSDSNLETVVFEEGSTLTKLPVTTFEKCTSLKSINIPSSVKDIEHSCFSACTSLESIVIPEGVEYIAMYAFSQSGLKNISLPSTLTYMGSYVFQDCSNLLSVDIPNALSTIKEATFKNCTSLQEVSVPEHLTYEKGAFSGCTSLSNLTIKNSDKDFVLDSKMYGPIFAFCDKDIFVEEGVTSLPNYAFSQATQVKSITLPSTITSIGSEAFNYVYYLDDDSNASKATIYVPNETIKSMLQDGVNYKSSYTKIELK